MSSVSSLDALQSTSASAVGGEHQPAASIPCPAEGWSISPSFGVLWQLLCLSWETLACSAALTLFTFGCGSPASSGMVLCIACFHQPFAATETAFAMRLALLSHHRHLQG